MADGGLDAVCREVVCKLYFEDHTLGNNLFTGKKILFYLEKLIFKFLKFPATFIFVLICQSRDIQQLTFTKTRPIL